MCIALVTTAHPSYAVIILDNRDEFILRPTSRPHWWSSHYQTILSARDLQRQEQGTWLGVTKTGKLAVLTNFRETDLNDANHPIQGERSRGGMVTAWLTSPTSETTLDLVQRLLDGEGVKGVGGFSLICGKLRRRSFQGSPELEPLAIVSNRCQDSQDVPWIAGKRNEVYGLSNTSYTDPVAWPKVASGKALLLDLVNEAVAGDWVEDQLVEGLYSILNTNTLPIHDGQSFEEYILQLKQSIFIPPIGGNEQFSKAPKADETATAGDADLGPITNGHGPTSDTAIEELKQDERPDPETQGTMTGCYGTQRQTIILVDWDGNVTFRERSLWDAEGIPVPQGKGDVKFSFKIDGWDGETLGNGVHPESML